MVDRIYLPVFLKRQRTAVLGVFLISATIFATFLLTAPESIMSKPCSDCAGWYYPVAENLAAGKGLVVGDNDRPALDRPPGHVLLLSGAFTIGRVVGFEKVAVVYALNVLLLSFAACLLFRISELFWGVKGGLVSAGLWSTSPFVLWFLNQPFSEVPFFACLFFATWIFLSQQKEQKLSLRRMFLVGVALGVAAMIRPIGVFLVAPFLLALWTSGSPAAARNLRISSTSIILGWLIMIAPWHIYVHENVSPDSDTSTGIHVTRSLIEGFVFGVKTEDYKVAIPLAPDVEYFMEELQTIFTDWREIPGGGELYGPGGTHDVQELENILAIAWDRLGADPILTARFLWLKVSRSWYGTDSHRNETVSLILQGLYLLIIIPGLIKTFLVQGKRPLGCLTLWVTLYFWAFAVVFTPLVRYMIPAVGLLFSVMPGILMFYKKKKVNL